MVLAGDSTGSGCLATLAQPMVASSNAAKAARRLVTGADPHEVEVLVVGAEVALRVELGT